jgi:hypothetical protein
LTKRPLLSGETMFSISKQPGIGVSMSRIAEP